MAGGRGSCSCSDARWTVQILLRHPTAISLCLPPAWMCDVLLRCVKSQEELFVDGQSCVWPEVPPLNTNKPLARDPKYVPSAR